MGQSNPPLARLFLIALLLAGLVIGALYAYKRFVPAPVVRPLTRPTTRPATRPVVAKAPKPLRDFMDLVLREHPAFPTTRPLDRNLDLSDAAHILVDDPVLLDPSGTLWITRDDGRPLDEVVEDPGPVNIVNRPVSFAHWHRDMRTGKWLLSLVSPNRRGNGFELIDQGGTRLLGPGTDYDWTRAFSLEDSHLGVPTSSGIAIFTIPARGMIGMSQSPPITTAPGAHAPVQYCFFRDSIIAWIPPTKTHPGSEGAVRWFKGTWLRLTGSEWPAGIIQLLPMQDSIVQLVGASGDTGTLKIVSMEKANVSDDQLLRLIAELSDPSPEVRQKAYEQLAGYRGTLWPVVERVKDAVPPETQARLKDLLRAKESVLVGTCEPIGQQLTLVARYANGGSLFYNDKGARIPQGDKPPVVISPAWISAMPGDIIRLLQGEFLKDVSPDRQKLWPTGSGSWIISDPVSGPRIYLGGGAYLHLMGKSECAFCDYVGMDRQGRSLFRKPGTTSPTLFIDPHLPDARPKLPVWSQQFAAVGWDSKGWPAVQLEKNHLIFGTSDWKLIDPKDKFLSTPDDIPPIAATWPADLGRPLLADSDGDLYFDGRQKLLILHKDGTRTEWPLPASAVGTAEPQLVRASNGRLFLFNEAGRILRLRPTPGGPDPFVLEATFSRGVPNVSKLTRMWIDPEGRLAMEWDGTNLAIAFPDGFIPMETRNLIPASVLDDMARQRE